MDTPTSPLSSLAAMGQLGQSPWLDFISRDYVASGKLAALVAADGIGGVTSNPAIFEKAIATGAEYEDALRTLAADPTRDANAIYEALAIADIQAAADVLAGVHAATNGTDGFVSLEVCPYLAHDTAGTVAEARRLWAAVDRPNLMVKVPGTTAGVAAIRQLIEDGISINVTLLFALDAYQAVAEAYVAGLEARHTRGLSVARIGSVASFFVSRIDAVIDRAIDTRMAAGDAQSAGLHSVRGKVAIANAKMAYAWFEDFCETPRWQVLQEAGAAPQRLLWASTGTKDPAYSDVLYVETLIGPQTVNTLPPATMDAFRDHGVAASQLSDNVDDARALLLQVDHLGLDLPGVTAALVEDGVRQFAQAADRLLAAVDTKRVTALAGKLSRVSVDLPDDLARAHNDVLSAWQADGKTRALWAHDANVWTNHGEAAWLGWLACPQAATAALGDLAAFAYDIAQSGITDVLLLGMGGSSLGAEVLGAILPGTRKLHVLDSTNPDQVARVVGGVSLATTLVIVASKSGSTLEPSMMESYVWAQAVATLGQDKAGAHFVAITDPGSALVTLATSKNYRRLFLGDPQIGGRFSVLSPFGLVVAAAIGADVKHLAHHARKMAASCAPLTPATTNPGVVLGTLLGVAARAGRDKLTLLMPIALAPLGAWLEQLIAESTGKHGMVILPINGETPDAANAYGADRIFADITLGNDTSDRGAALRQAGHPVLRINAANAADLAQQFFLWECATAVAGSVLHINPFDQPDVEAAKIKTRALTDAITATGSLPKLTDTITIDGFIVRAPGLNPAATIGDLLRAHLARAVAGDYVAILAYLDQTEAHTAELSILRGHLGNATRAATMLQFGPRFLHSTGQAFKGGPNSGIFVQITAGPIADLAVPGSNFSFGQVCEAQSRGDFDVLAERGRRIINIHITGPILPALRTLNAALDFSREA